MPSRIIVLVAVGLGSLVVHGAAARPAPSAANCSTVASAPFLYSVVIPVSAVQCDGTQRRLRIETRLTRDGLVVASASRTCRDTSVCWLTVDASAPDEPGNQLWCSVARGYAGTAFVGEAQACETDDF